ncbi:MAG: RdgB/HAM1 family non-canonical purine NTP pyrophosphatase [Myxococcales bacterium]|nr:RdgB/HAM1 family non-canonical purine NTP pyrophosphatase [Myxococcales bacterium]
MSAPRTLVFATRNKGKVAELQALLAGAGIAVCSLAELEAARGIALPEVIEDGATFYDNALLKARAIALATGLPALADDSGLIVDALGGAPGVFSARYAGEPSNDAANNGKLLAELAAVPSDQRTARFVASLVFCDVADGVEQLIAAEGVCEGTILTAPRGSGGFGYDPLFLSLDAGVSFAELTVAQKSQFSHRARAMAALATSLVAALQP